MSIAQEIPRTTADNLEELCRYCYLCVLLDFLPDSGTWGRSLYKAKSLYELGTSEPIYKKSPVGSLSLTAFVYSRLRIAGVPLPENMALITLQYILRMTAPDGSITGEGSVGPGNILETRVRHHITGLWVLCELRQIIKDTVNRNKIDNNLSDGLEWLIENEDSVMRIDKHTHSYSYAVSCFASLQESEFWNNLPPTIQKKIFKYNVSLLNNIRSGLYLREFVNEALCPEAKMFWTLLSYHLLFDAVNEQETTNKKSILLAEQTRTFLLNKAGNTPEGMFSLSGVPQAFPFSAYDLPSPTATCLAYNVAYTCLTILQQDQDSWGNENELAQSSSCWAEYSSRSLIGSVHNTIHSWVLGLLMTSRLGYSFHEDDQHRLITDVLNSKPKTVLSNVKNILSNDTFKHLKQEMEHYFI